MAAADEAHDGLLFIAPAGGEQQNFGELSLQIADELDGVVSSDADVDDEDAAMATDRRGGD
jgi:hypothetical protein